VAIKLVYIAGPYRAETAWGIENNVRRIEDIGARVAQYGALPIMPHANTRFFHGAFNLPDQFWLDAYLELVRRCDAVFCRDGSHGTNRELELADSLNIPIFHNFIALATWLNGQHRERG